METYIIPKEHHKDLYIFEGGLRNFYISTDQLNIVVSSVEYPDLPKNIKTPNYLDEVKIKFRGISYLNFELGYGYHGSQDGLVKIGEITEGDELLDYSGGLYPIGKEFDIPTNFNIEVICQDIELEF